MKKKQDDRRKRKRRTTAFFLCPLLLFLLMIGAICASVIVAVQLRPRSEVENHKALFEQSLTQINNNQVSVSVLFKNNLNETLEIQSITSDLVDLTCIPALPIVLLPSGIITCHGIYDFMPEDIIIIANTTAYGPNYNQTISTSIERQVFPYEICNHTAMQYGQNVNFQAFGLFSVFDFSADGNTMVFSNYTPAHMLIVMEYNGVNWVQKGANIMLPLIEDGQNSRIHGTSISDDGNTVASTYSGTLMGENTEIAIVYDFIAGTWTQRGNYVQSYYGLGPIISETMQNFISLSGDGNTFAFITEPDILNEMVNVSACVYDWSGSSWVMRGIPQTLFTYQRSVTETNIEPTDIKLSTDKNHFITKWGNLNATDTLFSQYTDVFEWNGSQWIRLGPTIVISYVLDRPIINVAISHDGSTIFDGNVYDWNGSAWVIRPRPPNIPIRFGGGYQRADMSEDGRFAIGTNNTINVLVTEWKPLQQEWVPCLDILIPIDQDQGFSLAYNLVFSRDVMHFMVHQSTNSGNPSFGKARIKTFSFMN